MCTGNTCVNIPYFAYPVEDATPPVVDIDLPSSLSNNCAPITITGRAYDPEGFHYYRLRYSADPAGPWTLIQNSMTPVGPVAGTLGTWNSPPAGYYYLQVVAYNAAGDMSDFTTFVHVDGALDQLQLNEPHLMNGQPPILGGMVCFDGTVVDSAGSHFQLEYRSYPNGAWANVQGIPSWPGQQENLALGTPWITNSGVSAVPDGNYEVRLTGFDDCGHTNSITRRVDIDNTPPVATIATPINCSSLHGAVFVTGTISDAHPLNWILQYTGGDSNGWIGIAAGTTTINNGLIATWSTIGLRPCAYVLRLVVSDQANVNCTGAGNKAEFVTVVDVGCPADFNRSGAVNSQDFFDFLNAYFMPCP